MSADEGENCGVPREFRGFGDRGQISRRRGAVAAPGSMGSVGIKLPQAFYEILLQLFGILRFALPNDNRLPTGFFQFADICLIHPNIGAKLLLPKSGPGLRGGRPFTACMAVLVAPVNKYYFSMLRQDDIRSTR